VQPAAIILVTPMAGMGFMMNSESDQILVTFDLDLWPWELIRISV